MLVTATFATRSRIGSILALEQSPRSGSSMSLPSIVGRIVCPICVAAAEIAEDVPFLYPLMPSSDYKHFGTQASPG